MPATALEVRNTAEREVKTSTCPLEPVQDRDTSPLIPQVNVKSQL